MLLIGDITFPRWNGNAQFDPYITEKHIDDALNRGQSLDAAERTAGANEFLIGTPPAADTEVIQRRGTNAPAPVPAAAPMDRKGR